MRNIIIISEKKELCSQLTVTLKRAGYSHIILSYDSSDALSLTYRLNPQLVIIDMELPSEDLNNLLKFLSGPMAKIVLFIAPHSNVDEQILELIKKGYSHFVIYPINDRLLINEVQAVIES